MANINSFSENMTELTNSVNDAMKMVAAFGETETSMDSSVSVTLANGETISMPSIQNLMKRMDRTENTVATFVKGSGVVETDDDTYRKIRVQTIAKSPQTIEDVEDVSTFEIDSNWFFESLMFPKCVIKINLKGKIEDNADRIYINRVILQYTDSDASTFYGDVVLADPSISYVSLIEKLNKEGIQYSEDEQEVSLPLSYEKFSGEFEILKTVLEEGVLWYYLDTVNYKQIDKNGNTISSSYRLSIGDYIRYNDSLFKITDIDQNAMKIAIEYSVGFETPAVGNHFEVYNDPYKEKIANIAIGFNEINIVYVKGINENYNILSKSWSNPITFITNNLVMNGGNMTLAEYYPNYVMDFGQDMIARAKQGSIYAINGIEPNVPVIDASALEVVQINTQLEATLNTKEYNNLTSSIVSTKSTVEDLRKNITKNKETLTKTTDNAARTTLQNTINNDTESLSTYTTQYNTLVEELNTLLNENGAIGYTPKYHIRGFFPIPQPVYTDDVLKTGKQEVIGFDIMYRYIHTDDTGTDLKTFNYTDKNSPVSAVFSDWNMMASKVKEQVYDEDLGRYVWKEEEVGDGTSIKINQIDIPIRSGEKVQIKVRSISEAGYPSNPLKSQWSDVVTIGFPSNLSGNDSVTNVINSAKDDKTAVVLQNTLSAAGLYTHLSDSTESYKHAAENISVTYTNNASTNPDYKITTNLQAYLDLFLNVNEINSMKNRILANERQIADLNGKIQYLLGLLGGGGYAPYGNASYTGIGGEV